jgi:RHS repeat-associated protein
VDGSTVLKTRPRRSRAWGFSLAAWRSGLSAAMGALLGDAVCLAAFSFRCSVLALGRWLLRFRAMVAFAPLKNSHSRSISRRMPAHVGAGVPANINKHRGLSPHSYDVALGRCNHLYSVAALTNSTGAVIERYRYDTYGNRTTLAPDGITTRTVSSYNQQVGFTGRYLDKETGLWYFRARYYSGSLGRFIGRDPLKYKGGMGLYVGYFVPNTLDPSGMIHTIIQISQVAGDGNPIDITAVGPELQKTIEENNKRVDDMARALDTYPTEKWKKGIENGTITFAGAAWTGSIEAYKKKVLAQRIQVINFNSGGITELTAMIKPLLIGDPDNTIAIAGHTVLSTFEDDSDITLPDNSTFKRAAFIDLMAKLGVNVCGACYPDNQEILIQLRADAAVMNAHTDEKSCFASTKRPILSTVSTAVTEP